MNLPDHLSARIRGLLDATETDPAVVQQLAAALADELTCWVQQPEGYVPREVLAGLLRDLGENLRQQSESRFPIAAMEQWRTLKQRLGEVNAGQCPAWFVLADWDRMTSEERRTCSRFVHEAFQHVGISLWHDDYHRIRDAMRDARTGRLLAMPAGAEIRTGQFVYADPDGRVRPYGSRGEFSRSIITSLDEDAQDPDTVLRRVGVADLLGVVNSHEYNGDAAGSLVISDLRATPLWGTRHDAPNRWQVDVTIHRRPPAGDEVRVAMDFNEVLARFAAPNIHQPPEESR